MSRESAEAVVDRLEADEEFARRVKDAGGQEASLAVIRSEGFDVTGEDMRDVALDRYGDQLTTEQLEAVAGGLNETEEAEIIVGVAIGVPLAMIATAVAASAV